MATTVGTIKQRFQTAVANNPAYGISANVQHDSYVVAGGSDGMVMVRDSTQPDGWGLLSVAGLVTPVTVAEGGTGIVSYTVGDVLYADSTTSFARLADVAAGSYMRSGGVTTAPLWSTLLLPNAATRGDLMVATSANTIGALATVAAGQVLVSGSVPAWSASPTLTSLTIGSESMTVLAPVGNNLFAGVTAGNLTLSGTDNSSYGGTSLASLTSGGFNAAFGWGSGHAITAGTGNTSVGVDSLRTADVGTFNTAIGNDALYGTTSGNYNVAVGVDALRNNEGQNGVVAIGRQAGYTYNGNYGVFLGYQAGYWETGAGKLFIDNVQRASEADGRVKALIYGVFNAAVASQQLYVNASLYLPNNAGGLLFGHASGGTFDSVIVYNNFNQMFIGDDANTFSLNLSGGSGKLVIPTTNGDVALGNSSRAWASVNANGYSVAGTAGISASITTAALAGKTITVVNGIITGFA